MPDKTLEVAGRRYESHPEARWLWMNGPIETDPIVSPTLADVLDALWAERQKAEGWRLVAEGRARLMVCYRLGVGSGRRVERAMRMIDAGRRKLAEAGVDLEAEND